MFDFKITLFVYLLGSGLNCIFHWNAHLLIFCKPEFNFFIDVPISRIFKKREVSLANLLHVNGIPSERSLIKLKYKIDPNTDPCGTLEFIFLHSDVWPFNITLCLWLSR